MSSTITRPTDSEELVELSHELTHLQTNALFDVESSLTDASVATDLDTMLQHVQYTLSHLELVRAALEDTQLRIQQRLTERYKTQYRLMDADNHFYVTNWMDDDKPTVDSLVDQLNEAAGKKWIVVFERTIPR